MRRVIVVGLVALFFVMGSFWGSGCSQPPGQGEGSSEATSGNELNKEVAAEGSGSSETNNGEESSSGDKPSEEKSGAEPGKESAGAEPTNGPEETPSSEESTTNEETPAKEEAPVKPEKPNGSEPGVLEKLNPDAGAEPSTPEKLPTDSAPGCGKLGAKIPLTGTCCSGLKKGSSGTPPNCATVGQTFICVNCGDNKCDTANGENECNCSQDCTQTGNGCEQAGGSCQNSRLPCKPGTVQDNSLSCGSPAKICCKPSGSGGCKVDCDCTQGLLCAPGTGRCVAGIVPAYCCDKSGCPSGKACTDSSGAKGVCP